MQKHIAEWHGEKAADAYLRWMYQGKGVDLRDYERHALIADRFWKQC